GLVFDHGVDGEAQGAQQVLEQFELSEQFGFDFGAVLVTVVELVAKRWNDVVGGDGDVGGTVFEQGHHRTGHTTGRGDFGSVIVDVGGEGEVVTEQLVGSVDQVDLHGGLPRRRHAGERSQVTAAASSRRRAVRA